MSESSVSCHLNKIARAGTNHVQEKRGRSKSEKGKAGLSSGERESR